MTNHLPEGGAGHGTASNVDAGQALREASNISPEGGVLEPCPFCGSEAVFQPRTSDKGMIVLGCSDRDCIGHQIAYDYVREEDAARDWNTRSAAPPISPRGGSEANTQAMVGHDDPVWPAWKAYEATAEYANTRHWASDPKHTEGSLWAAFVAGFRSSLPTGSGEGLIQAQMEASNRAHKDPSPENMAALRKADDALAALSSEAGS